MADSESERKQKLKSVISRGVALKPNTFHKLNDDLKRIHEMWNIIDAQINDPKSPYLLKKPSGSSQRVKTRSRPIRVFVSSTFTDFFSEREILVKQFFPELRHWCLKRNMDLIECDLRWGVPADSTSDNTILTCLRELDRCYKDNEGQPFFIGLLGEKYGWVPDMPKLAPEIVQEYNWIPGISITFMEYLHGALRSKNGNACFFIRSKDALEGIPKEYHEKFFETVPMSKLQLQVEKEKLRANYKKQVIEYSAKFDGFDETTGRKRPKISGLEEFGNKVISFLKNAIVRTYPDVKIEEDENHDKQEESPEDKIEDENRLQEMFISENTDFFVGQEEEIKIIMEYALHGSISNKFKLFDEVDRKSYTLKDPVENIHGPLIVIGDRGSGKSALMAHIVNLLTEKGQSVFYHFFGASTSNLATFFYRFLHHFSAYIDVSSYELNLHYDSHDNITTFNKAFEDIAEKTAGIRKVIIIDEPDDSGTSEWLSFLKSEKLDSSFSFIFTSDQTDYLKINTIVKLTQCYSFKLNYFSKELSQLYIQKYLEKYNKKLDQKQMNIILAKSDQTNNVLAPQWLFHISNELKIFGEFTTVTKKIENFPIGLDELVVQILMRINSDFKNNVVIDFLCFLSSSHMGLPENEIPNLLSHSGHAINRLEWSQIYLNLRNFLRTLQQDNTQLIRFSNYRYRQIVFDYFTSQGSKQVANLDVKTSAQYCVLMSSFFRSFSQYRNLATIQCYFCYKDLHQKRELVEFMSTDEAKRYINGAMRSTAFDIARCTGMPHSSITPDTVLMCNMCSIQRGSYFSSKAQSCVVCGNYTSQQLARLCGRHNPNNGIPKQMYKCYYCKQLISLNTKAANLRPTEGRLCSICNPMRCCFLELD